MESTERRYGKVFVATIDEASGMSFERVFVPGLGEDIFPQRAFEDPFGLLDELRRMISPDLAIQETRVAEERWRFHLAAGSAERTLFISHPRMNLAQARARGPSFYALEVVRAITGRVPDHCRACSGPQRNRHAVAGRMAGCHGGLAVAG